MYKVTEVFEYLVNDNTSFLSVHDILDWVAGMTCPLWDGYQDILPKNSEGEEEYIPWGKRQITNIIGVGRGINYDVVNTQGGKTKYLCSIDTSLVFGRPDICFYFKK